MSNASLKHIWLLTAFCGFLFLAGNNAVPLTNPDEVFYSLTAREMSAKGDWLTPYIFNQPQFEKPIFIYWLLNAAVNIFGPTPFAARFFPAVFALLGVLAVYGLGVIGFRDERRAFWSAVSLASAAFYFAMAKTVFTDMVFAVFILYSLLSFYVAFDRPHRKKEGILGFYFFAALAVLTKGPLGLMVPELTVLLFLMYRRQMDWLREPWIGVGFFLGAAVALPWYVYMTTTYGNAFIHEFFYNDHWRRWIEAEHRSNDHWFFYLLTMLAGMFPWTPFVAVGLAGLYRRLKGQSMPFDHFLISWVLVVFVVFQGAHSKLASYILPVFPALALIAGGVIGRYLIDESKEGALKKILLGTAALPALLGIAVVALKHLYQAYLPSPLPAYFLSALLITWAGVIAVLALKSRTREALAVLAAIGVPFLIGMLLVARDITPYVSSYSAAQYVPHGDVHKTTLLCNKPEARGLRYYTGQDIAVMNINGGNYFSPHPIPILDTMDKVRDFLQARKKTYAVLRKGAYADIRSLDQGLFRTTLLGHCGAHYVLMIEYLGNP